MEAVLAYLWVYGVPLAAGVIFVASVAWVTVQVTKAWATWWRG